MSPFLLAILFIILLTSFLSIRRTTSKHRKNDQKLPPGPPPLPIIGNLHMLGILPHQTLYHLAKKYGPIMLMKLGSIPIVVASSPKAAELFLKTHDHVFATRPKLQAALHVSYGGKGVIFAEYGPYWLNMKKLCSLQLLSSSKIESSAPMKREELELLVKSFKKAAAAREVVDFSASVRDSLLNMNCRMVFGVARNGEFDLKPLIEEFMKVTGAFNVADYFPHLGVFDLQGLTKRIKAFSKATDNILEKIIDEHEREARWQRKEQIRDFVDGLLSLMNQPMKSNGGALYTIDRTNIKALLLDMIVGSFDTSAAAIDWILTELIRHPHATRRLQDELQSVVGIDNLVEEKQLSKLPYLNMVIKESLRLHPSLPLLAPHETMEDITIDGYHIPKKCRVLVNVWAIGRDPDVWSNNVDQFLPERFIDKDIDFRGHDFELIPFGSGRRGCPGLQMGMTTIQLVIAQLVHCFDWELPNGFSPNELDMGESFGLSLPRATHLLLVPKYRLLIG